jgi:NAD(P)-dependent dehydrogenase (short-subunit alcohol dehydrogenase family)
MPSSVVLVTGCSTGIGAAAALDLDRAGYTVFAGIRRAEDADQLRARGSERLRPIELDVTRSDQVARAAELIETETGATGLRGLVNNAGIVVGGPLEFLSLEDFRAQFEVNVFGLLAVTQALLPALRLARGRIVNIGSVSGKTVTPLIGAYAASKHALEAMSDALRLELAPWGIDVALIEPGPVQTAIWDKGRDALARAPEVYSDRALELYGPRMAVVGRLAEASGAAGVTTDPVVGAIRHALEARRPKTRYLIGRGAWLRAGLRWLLPDRVMDALIQRYLRRMERAGA